jgi:membrane-associated phospholipid phosphatase
VHQVVGPSPASRVDAQSTAALIPAADQLISATRQRLTTSGVAMAAAARNVNAVIAAPQERRSTRAFRQRPLVYSAMAGYAVLSIGLMASKQVGLTSEHVIILGLVGFAVVGRARPFVWDWLPFLFVAVMFEDLTAVGAHLAGGVHDIGPLVFEKSWLGGVLATTWLQDRIGTGPVAHWFGVVLTSEYLFHFAAPLVAGLWLWLRHRDRFGTFVGAYILVMSLGFVTYLVYPEMPPWLAAQRGLGHIPPVHRIAVETLQNLGGFGNFYAGADPEPNAAMPSLHVSVPMIIACSIIAVKGWGNRRAWLWMLYPVTISFGVVYLGEHYISDTVVGLLLGVACFLVAELGHRYDAARRETATVPVRA